MAAITLKMKNNEILVGVITLADIHLRYVMDGVIARHYFLQCAGVGINYIMFPASVRSSWRLALDINTEHWIY